MPAKRIHYKMVDAHVLESPMTSLSRRPIQGPPQWIVIPLFLQKVRANHFGSVGTCQAYILERQLNLACRLLLKNFHWVIYLGHFTCTRCRVSILLKNVHVVFFSRGTIFDSLGEVRRQGVSCNWRSSLYSLFQYRWSESLSFPSNTHPRKL
jgi:hypothetical protein